MVICYLVYILYHRQQQMVRLALNYQVMQFYPSVVIFALLVVWKPTFAWVPLPAPYTEHCIVGEKNEYDPSKVGDVPWFNIDLDTPPYQRWQQVATLYKTQMATA